MLCFLFMVSPLVYDVVDSQCIHSCIETLHLHTALVFIWVRVYARRHNTLTVLRNQSAFRQGLARPRSGKLQHRSCMAKLAIGDMDVGDDGDLVALLSLQSLAGKEG